MEKSSADVICQQHCDTVGEKRMKSSSKISASTSGDCYRHVPVSIAHFHRKEIQLGKQIGEGYFSKVYEVSAFRLRSDSADDVDNSYSTTSSSKEEQSAREYCQRNAQLKNGQARYVMKHLNPRLLSEKSSLVNAAFDLVTEAKFLSELDHPNILKLRGTARGTPFQGGGYDCYFIIIDRLGDTLAQRIQRWRRWRRQRNGGQNAPSPPSLEQKMGYAGQIAQALLYLHQQRLILRDLKPDNIGFVASDDCSEQEAQDRLQIFDLGLCRRLPEKSLDEETEITCNDVFEMSGVGTRRYMSPEACLQKPYNQKSDVYSWSMVFVEILTEQKPFAEFTKEEHHKFVCQLGGCPNLSKWSFDVPDLLKDLLRKTWCHNVGRRWTMAQVCEKLHSIQNCHTTNSHREASGAPNTDINPTTKGKSCTRFSEEKSSLRLISAETMQDRIKADPTTLTI